MKLSEEGRNLAQRYLSKKVRASDFFLSEDYVTVKDLSSANTVYLVGLTLARTSREFLYTLGQRLTTGATVRFIILDPELDSVLEQAYLRSFIAPIEFWRDTLKTTEKVIDALAKSPNSKGTVEVGYLPYIPSFGLVMIDPDQSHGICFVEIYQHRSAEPHATFQLRASDDQYWFKYFQEQFDGMWKSCRVKILTQSDKEDPKRQSTNG